MELKVENELTKEEHLSHFNKFLQLHPSDAKQQICYLFAEIRRSGGNLALQAADALYHLLKLSVRELAIKGE